MYRASNRSAQLPVWVCVCECVCVRARVCLCVVCVCVCVRARACVCLCVVCVVCVCMCVCVCVWYRQVMHGPLSRPIQRVFMYEHMISACVSVWIYNMRHRQWHRHYRDRFSVCVYVWTYDKGKWAYMYRRYKDRYVSSSSMYPPPHMAWTCIGVIKTDWPWTPRYGVLFLINSLSLTHYLTHTHSPSSQRGIHLMCAPQKREQEEDCVFGCFQK